MTKLAFEIEGDSVVPTQELITLCILYSLRIKRSAVLPHHFFLLHQQKYKIQLTQMTSMTDAINAVLTWARR